MLLSMALWRIDLRKFICMSFTVPLVAYQQPAKKRASRNGAKKRPDGPNFRGGKFYKKTKNRPLQIQIHHAQEWDKGTM